MKFKTFLHYINITSLIYSINVQKILFVRPSVSHIMSAQYHEKFLSDSHGTW